MFTHRWAEPNEVETLVSVEFTDHDDGCEVSLTQQGFTDTASAKGHEEGWASVLRNLARQFP